jgi:hypothetical protein
MNDTPEPISVPDAALDAYEAKEALWASRWYKPQDDLPDDLPPALRAFLDEL